MTTEGCGASAAGAGIHNGDAFRVQEGLGLYVVFDGASDRGADEVAARIARDAVAASVQRSAGDPGQDSWLNRIDVSVVVQAMKHALCAVAEAEKTDPALAGLATTITLVLAHGHLGVIGHRGDSRAYLIRGDQAHLLTVDHELTGPVAHDRAPIGEFVVFEVALRPNDTVVLCTDGAVEVVEEPIITRAAGRVPPRALASRIASEARLYAPELGTDAVVVRLLSDRTPGWLELSRAPRETRFGHFLELA